MHALIRSSGHDGSSLWEHACDEEEESALGLSDCLICASLQVGTNASKFFVANACPSWQAAGFAPSDMTLASPLLLQKGFVLSLAGGCALGGHRGSRWEPARKGRHRVSVLHGKGLEDD